MPVLELMNGTGVTANDRAEAREIEDAVWEAHDDPESDIEVVRLTTTKNDDGTFTVAVNTRYLDDDREAFETELRGLHEQINKTLDPGADTRMTYESV